ncbi:MAG TPA: undecaprenyl-diphosphate phosphatase [Caldisericia bacterium]|nr:MAG: Undecaprenyl-diphosphatase [bacterium ADurb.Bin132]HNW31520.1 undecaprenyl-diphosphate phosphatase [Caldisericia bacterium]HNY60760.1 undecaprenyl-diphosphate phosphatase [Caldisericia bacterium]HOC79002.1 undecaprenyl-diphosphate phosphatase [Caldisericia bacterium]HOG69801.1 undecaprenyl-diphosphate phosphatase [Caldisericia bacterium]
MGIIEALVLGLVQGLTEFIPVSSTAHLVLVPAFLGWGKPPMWFDVFLHAGTLLGIIIFFWPEVVKYVKAFFTGLPKIGRGLPPDSIFSYNLILSVVPAIIFGLFFESRIESVFQDPKTTSYLLLVTAAFLVVASLMNGKRKLEETTWVDAITVGCAQAIAMFPGISRSGATITAARLLGFGKKSSSRLAFLIAIPAVGAATAKTLYDVYKMVASSGMQIDWMPSIVGFVVAAVVGYLSFFLFFKAIQKFNFYIFAAYCVALFVVAQILL